MLNRKLFLTSATLIGGLILAACSPTTIIQTVEVTKEVVKETTKVVVETQVSTVKETVVSNQTVVVNVEKEPFTTPHPILGDVRVRQAIAYCTNRLDLIKSVYPLLSEDEQKTLLMDTFIPTAHWAHANEGVTQYDFNPDTGKKLLDDAGWKVPDGGSIRANDKGEELSLKFTTTTAAFRQTWAAVLEKQMSACGIRMLRFHVPASWWFGDTTGLARRDFEMGAFAWVGTADPSGESLYSCNKIPSPKNNWEGQNYMGWCNEKASQAIVAANNTLIQADRIKNYVIAQQEFAKDLPSLPLFNRTETFAYAPDLTGFDPKPGESYYTYNVEQWERKGQDTIVIGFTQEPASLYTVVEDAWVANIAANLVGGYFSVAPNYTYTPILQKQLSTIENKLATNSDVDVKAGDMVYDVNGKALPLAAGVKVMDNTGKTVEYKDGTIKMKQLVVKYEVVDGLKWSDGTPVTKADWDLYYTVRCNKESGATTFTICDQTGKFESADNGYTITWLPGVQSPTYFLFPYAAFPAHQPINSDGPYKGKTLADVAPKDYATLPEVAEKPLGFGPYVITDWVKGEKMTFEANPNYVLGAPKTPKLVIKFLTAENAEAQLLNGDVDTLGSETLAGIDETLDKAAKDGKIKVHVHAGATWEHIDFSLFVK